MNDQDRAVLGSQIRFYVRLGDRVAPSQLDLVDLHAEFACSFRVEASEVTILEAQDALARIKRVDDRRFPSSRAAAREEDGLAALRLEDGPQSGTDLRDESLHFGTAVNRDRPIHRPEDALRDIRRTGNLEKVTTGAHIATSLYDACSPLASSHGRRPDVTFRRTRAE